MEEENKMIVKELRYVLRHNSNGDSGNFVSNYDEKKEERNLGKPASLGIRKLPNTCSFYSDLHKKFKELIEDTCGQNPGNKLEAELTIKVKLK